MGHLLEIARSHVAKQPQTTAPGTQRPIVSAPACVVHRPETSRSEISAACDLLNAAGARLWEGNVGIWEDTDSPELRQALALLRATPHLAVVYLDSAEAPPNLKVRHCPERKPGEAWQGWKDRAMAAFTRKRDSWFARQQAERAD